MKDRAAIVLASGKGTRMKSDIPKVLHLVGGKPMVNHVVDAARIAGAEHIIIVVGHKAEDVMASVGNNESFVYQPEQLGTGHAVLLTENSFTDPETTIVVLCGDAPLVLPETIKKLMDYHESTGADATVLTAIVDDPFGYGRIVRDSSGNLERIVEEKDASPEERGIKEINTGTYCFRAGTLFKYLKQVGNDNAQKEYYLPDVLEIIRKNKGIIRVMSSGDPTEVLGVNTLEQLQFVEEVYKKRKEK